MIILYCLLATRNTNQIPLNKQTSYTVPEQLKVNDLNYN